LWRSALILALLCFAVQASTPGDPPARYLISNVPGIIQLPNYCGPAALASVLGYWGDSVTQTAIGQKTFDKRHAATNGAELLLFARDRGYVAFSYDGSIADLKTRVAQNLPVIVLQYQALDDKRGHFRVVMGYDDDKKLLYTRDSNYESVRAIPYATFAKLWEPYGNWSLIVAPTSESAKLSGLDRNNVVLHLDLGQAYLRRNNTSLATAHLREALRLEPGNEEAVQMLMQISNRGASGRHRIATSNGAAQ
jgi:predicted double-glycine peptidase